MNKALANPSRRLRASIARATAASNTRPVVDREGGVSKAGLIPNVSIATRGEALGHDVWLDSDFIESVADAINDTDKGVKARFTHPGLSGDGLGTFLGRVMNAKVKGDQVIGDLHFSKAAHNTPDGNLAEYVMDLAESDPDAFGVSIVFDDDTDAEEAFAAAHETAEGFRSPDTLNEKHLLHVRLATLRAADVVDSPAANPGGMFHRQDIAHEAEALVSHALGLTNDAPKLSRFDIHPERLRGFVARFLNEHGLEVVRKSETAMDDATNPTPATESQAADTNQAEPTAAPITAAPAESQGELAQTQEEAPVQPAVQMSENNGKRFLDAFGDKGGVWFAQGMTFEQAQEQYVKELKAENDALKARVGTTDRGADPVKFQAESAAKSRGLAGLVKIASRAK